MLPANKYAIVLVIMQDTDTHKIVGTEVYKKTLIYKFLVSESEENQTVMFILATWYNTDFGNFVLQNSVGDIEIISQPDTYSYSRQIGVIACLTLEDMTYIKLKWPESNIQ